MKKIYKKILSLRTNIQNSNGLEDEGIDTSGPNDSRILNRKDDTNFFPSFNFHELPEDLFFNVLDDLFSMGSSEEKRHLMGALQCVNRFFRHATNAWMRLGRTFNSHPDLYFELYEADRKGFLFQKYFFKVHPCIQPHVDYGKVKIDDLLNSFKSEIQRGQLICDVPDMLWTTELAQIVIEIPSISVEYIPTRIWTLQLATLAIEEFRCNAKYIPEGIWTTDLARLAIEKVAADAQYVPDSVWTKELARLTIEKDGFCAQYVPASLWTTELGQFTLEKWSVYAHYIPKDILTSLGVSK